MQPEIAFPYATGIILFVGVAIILYIWRQIGVNALFFLAIGLLSVAIESILDGYEASIVLSYGGWNNIPADDRTAVMILDTIRGIFIVIWAGIEFLFAFMIGAVENKKITYGIPALVIIAGTLQTIYFNLMRVDYKTVEDLEAVIFASSAVRVLVFLVPAALFAGAFILYTIYFSVGTKSSLYYGIGFLVHGLTLPFYSIMKEQGPAFLGLWYALGGVIPAVLATYGSYMLMKETREEVEEEEEAGEEE